MDREFDSIMMVGVNDQYGLGGADDRLSLQPSLWGNSDGVTGADGVSGKLDFKTGKKMALLSHAAKILIFWLAGLITKMP